MKHCRCSVRELLSLLILLLSFFFPTDAISEEPPSKNLPEIYVTASRTEKSPVLVPATVYQLSSQTVMEEKMVRTLPEALMEVPGIMVQKTSQGQGSPYLRGFTGYRTLFLIDGIRLNNSTFREGPNQYWNTVDVFSVNRLEVVKGPASVLYGSDAIGGTVNALTVEPLFAEKGSLYNGKFYGRYSSGERSWIGRGEAGGSYNGKVGLIAGITGKDFGNVIGGSEVGEQHKTGYNEWDGDIKFEFRPAQNKKIVLAHQRVDLDDAWRTHKTIYGINWKGTTHGNELKRIIDQDRNLTYLQYKDEKVFNIFKDVIISLSFQEQKESRGRVKSSGTKERQGTYVGTTGIWVQASTQSFAGLFTYGADYYHDSVTSYKKKYYPDGTLQKIYIQGPVADDSTYDLVGAFIQDDIFFGDQFEVIAGGRFTYAHADADKIADPITGAKSSLQKHWTAFTGSLKGIYFLDNSKHFSIYGGISQAFRAPNLSDLTRFDTARSNEIETPSPDLDPEQYICYEVGVKAEYKGFSSQLSYFYTDLNDMIIRTPTGRIIDGDYEVTKKNAGDGYVNGVEVSAAWEFYPGLTVNGSLSWMYGEVDTYPTSTADKEREPLDRLMPLTCQGGLKWQPSWRYWIEGIIIHADKQDKLSTRDEHDTDRIPPGGTPSYTILTLRGGFRITPDITLSCAVENMADVDYRIHGSGVNEPGLNVVAALDINF